MNPSLLQSIWKNLRTIDLKQLYKNLTIQKLKNIRHFIPIQY